MFLTIEVNRTTKIRWKRGLLHTLWNAICEVTFMIEVIIRFKVASSERRSPSPHLTQSTRRCRLVCAFVMLASFAWLSEKVSISLSKIFRASKGWMAPDFGSYMKHTNTKCSNEYIGLRLIMAKESRRWCTTISNARLHEILWKVGRTVGEKVPYSSGNFILLVIPTPTLRLLSTLVTVIQVHCFTITAAWWDVERHKDNQIQSQYAFWTKLVDIIIHGKLHAFIIQVQHSLVFCPSIWLILLLLGCSS